MAITKTVNFTLEVLAPTDITCSILPVSQSVRLGLTAHYTLTLQSVNGFVGAVAIVLSGLGSARNYSATLAANGTATVAIDLDTTGLAVQTYPLVLTITA